MRPANPKYIAPIVDDQLPIPGLEKPAAPASQTRDWPDLSAYGLHFGTIRLPNSEQRLVMVDENDAWAEHAPMWGFQPSRWVGLWTKAKPTITIPGFTKLFPNAKIVKLTEEEIRDKVSHLVIKRQQLRISQVGQGASRRMSWHPTKRLSVGRKGPAELADDTTPDIPADVALQQIIYLGHNHLDQQVFERGDGGRFIKVNGTTAAVEDSDKSSPLFLRLDNENKTDSLRLCALGLAKEMESGAVLRSSDFERYLKAIFEQFADDPAAVTAFHDAVDGVLVSLAADSTARTFEAYDLALRLHECRPTYYRANGQTPTPLPIATLMHSFAESGIQKTGIASPRVIDLSNCGNWTQSWRWPSATKIDADQAIPAHDISVTRLSAAVVDPQSVSGVKLTKAEHIAILRTLESRADDGTSCFFVDGAFNAGELETEFKRVMSYIGTNYEIQGAADFDALLLAPGNQRTGRLVVVGSRRAAPDLTYGVPLRLTVHYDYESIWKWAESRISPSDDEHVAFGDDDDGRTVNRWQAPYIPSSQVSEPSAMSPRNLLGPVRKALANIVSVTGMSIDDYVATKLQWSMEELEVLNAEQVDAVALGIFGMDNGYGCVEADQTGLGKGRVCAAMMRYGRLSGLDVLFITDNASLFSDIYRDIEDIGSLHLFRDPCIINSDFELVKGDGEVLGRSAARDDLIDIFESGKPSGHSIMLSTYSQFNRPPSEDLDLETSRAASSSIKLAKRGANRLEVLREIDGYTTVSRTLGYGNLHLDHPILANVQEDNRAAISVIKNYLSSPRANPGERAGLGEQLRLREANNDQLIEHLESLRISDINTLRQNWIRSQDMNNVLVVMDESHVGAGPTSQTNQNLRELNENAKATIYSSATFSQSTDHFELYSSIFPDSVPVHRISETLRRGGAPLQEILSAMLAADGRIIRREHDLSNIDFRMSVDTARRERNEEWTNSLAAALGAMGIISGEISEYVEHITFQAEEAERKRIESLNLGVPGGRKKLPKVKLDVGVEYTNFSSRFYNLNRAFQLALTADMNADLAIDAIREGRKPVITIDQTMEETLKDLMDPDSFTYRDPGPIDQVALAQSAQGPDLLGDGYMSGDRKRAGKVALLDGARTVSIDEDLKPVFALGRRVGFKDILREYANNLFYGWEYSTDYSSGKAKKVKKRKDLALPHQREALEAVQRIIDRIPDISLSPLDVLKDKIRSAGLTVSELSGRRLSLQTDSRGNHVICRMASRTKRDLIDAFNAGNTDVMLLSRSGSTGFSFHSSVRFADQRQRELIEWQPAAAIQLRLQFWGRVNRLGQVSPPIIRFTSSGMPGETRLLMMQITKLREMSANISGNADNAAIDENLPDIINSVGNEVCFRWLESNPEMAKKLSIPIGDMRNEAETHGRSGTRFVDLLTGRILMLGVEEQRQVYREITCEFNALLEQYVLEGRNPLKSGELDVGAARGRSVTLEVPPSAIRSVFNDPVIATEINYRIEQDGIEKGDLLDECSAARDLLIDRFANADWIPVVQARATEMAPKLLSARHPSVEAALAEEAPNAVKNLLSRAEFLQTVLRHVVPGSTFTIGNEEEGDATDYIVVGLTIPESDREMINPSAYTLKVRARTDRRVQSLSLSTIMRGSNQFAPKICALDSKYEQRIQHELRDFTKPIRMDVNRVILEGNLFNASAFADKHKMGQAITYTDDKGTWHHAILMPSKFSLEDANKLPIHFDDPRMLAELLRTAQGAKVTDGFNAKTKGWELSKVGDRYVLHISDERKSSLWLMGNKKLESTFMGSWSGMRNNRIAYIAPDRLEEFCSALVEGAGISGQHIMASSYHRNWCQGYAERIRKEGEIEVALPGAGSSNDLDALDEEFQRLGFA